MKTIVVIEDHEPMVKLLRKLLENAGYQVVAFSAGADALKFFADQAAGLAVVDLNLPGISGDLLASEIRHRQPDIKILLVSGIMQPQEISGLLQPDQIAFLAKPWHNQDFLKQVQALCPLEP